MDSAEALDRILDVQAAGRDLVLGIGVTFGVGYGLNSPRNPISPNPRFCYWGGWGGSFVLADVDRKLTVAYMMNTRIGCVSGMRVGWSSFASSSRQSPRMIVSTGSPMAQP